MRAQRFQKFRLASISPCSVFSIKSGGAPNDSTASFFRSMPSSLAAAWISSQPLSIAPPATASFLPLRSARVLAGEALGTMTAPTEVE